MTRVFADRSPDGREALVLAAGTQFPDLVDKPGNWVFGVLPTGTSVAHSIFVASFVSVAIIVLARRRSRTALGAAFAVGYLSHLAGDVFFYILIGGGPAFGVVLWPLTQTAGGGTQPVLSTVDRLFSRWLAYLASPVGFGYVLLEVALLSLAVWVWIRDKSPGLDTVARFRTVL